MTPPGPGGGPVVAAVDFGATSIRVATVDLGRRPLEPVIVHRHRHGPVRHGDGSLRWDWDRLVLEARRGLGLAAEAAPLASIGIATWGLDYGLLDAEGRLVAPPHSYRDERTERWGETADRIGRRRLYDVTGIQLMAGNTVFQLAAHDRGELERTQHVLMLPELLIHDLCGVVRAERTSAGTTALVDLASGTWSAELIGAIGADPDWFPVIGHAGECAGRWNGIPVTTVGGHDTASAVLAMGPDPAPDAAFLSAGTWFLVGREAEGARTDDGCFSRNLSNEPGIYGGVRLLANVPGMWLLEECRRTWAASSVEALLAGSESVGAREFDVADPSLVAPADMPVAVRRLAGLPPDVAPAVVIGSIVESLAGGVAEAVDRLGVAGPVGELVVFGGASRATSLMERIGERCGLPVRTGPAEATVLGNALAQGLGLGVFDGVPAARRALGPPD